MPTDDQHPIYLVLFDSDRTVLPSVERYNTFAAAERFALSELMRSKNARIRKYMIPVFSGRELG